MNRYRESPLVILTKKGYFGAASTLVKCGYDFKKDRQFQNLNLENQNLSTMEIECKSYKRIGYEEEKKEFLELLKECQVNNIFTLSSLCLNMLSKHLTTLGRGAEVESKIDKLLIPTKIKEFLAFRDTIQNMERMEVEAIERYAEIKIANKLSIFISLSLSLSLCMYVFVCLHNLSNLFCFTKKPTDFILPCFQR